MRSGSVAVILPAAGASARYGASGGRGKKVFADLAGKPVWQHALDLFARRPEVSHAYLVLSNDDLAEFRARYGPVLLFAYGNVEVVGGGAARADSVANALRLVPESVEFVAVHDAARPLTPPSVIDAAFAEASRGGAALVARRVADTLKRLDPATGTLTTVSREHLYAAQTPQVARREWLVEAYAARHKLDVPVTDDAQLLEALGKPAGVVEGSAANFKITTADDLELAEALLRRGEARPAAEARRAGPVWAEDAGDGDGEGGE